MERKDPLGVDRHSCQWRAPLVTALSDAMASLPLRLRLEEGGSAHQRSSGMASVEVAQYGRAESRTRSSAASRPSGTVSMPSVGSTSGNSFKGRGGYHMRTGMRRGVSPESSLRESDALIRGRLSSTFTLFRGADEGDRHPVNVNRKAPANLSWAQRRFYVVPFEDARIEVEFKAIQKKAAKSTLKTVVVLLSLIELVTLTYDIFVPPGPLEVFLFRTILSLFCFSVKMALVRLAAQRYLGLLSWIHVKAGCFVLLQTFVLVATQHRRALLLFGYSSKQLCVEDKIAKVYCDSEWVTGDSMLLLCLVIFLASVSYTLGMVNITVISGVIVQLVYTLYSLALGIAVHFLDAAMLWLFCVICIWGSIISETRLRDLFDRTMLTREALRRNRKLRASFDRHVDNERTLLEQTQMLQSENSMLREQAGSLGDAMSGIQLESPLLSSIHDLRDLQRYANATGNYEMAETLERVVQTLQSRSLQEIDVSIGSKHNAALDANTREWLSAATSGWEARRMKDRKDRKHSHARQSPRESVVDDGDQAAKLARSKTGIAPSPVPPGSPQTVPSLRRMDTISNDGGDLSSTKLTSSKIQDADADMDDIAALPPQQRTRAPPSPANRATVATGSPASKYASYAVKALPTDGTKELLAAAGDWDRFDIFKFCEATEFPLTALVEHAVEKHHTLDFLDISHSRMLNFLRYVDRTYCYGQAIDMSRKECDKQRNPYHNNWHAADVVQSMFCFLNAAEVYRSMSHTDLFSAIIAAAVHDYCHPGRTNQFLVTQGHPIAIQHNDQSPNERFHLSQAFKLLQDDRKNFLIRLNRKQRLEVRQTIIDLVLATDLSQTMKYLSSFQLFLACHADKAGSGPGGPGRPGGLGTLEPVKEESARGGSRASSFSSATSLDSEESILLLQIAIKVADISHPAKPRDQHVRWSELIQEEFFIQGDIQKEIGDAPEPLCDRNVVIVTKAQMGFIDFVCRPLIQPFCMFIDMPCMLENLVSNYSHWSSQDDSSDEEKRKGRRGSLLQLRR